ncbi:MAG TPA: transglycosylase SLT domain-containing protein [Rhodanobacter sp.]|nr:transglycosylase SLT domain-containing protein [Rhodanobacter sp.]
MLPGLEMLACPNLAVSPEVMQHIVQVESGANPYAIGVVGGRLVRQPRNMDEALATARMLESKGYNFSLGVAQVNRSNLDRYGLDSYRRAFNTCANLAAGARILAGCYGSAHGDWGKAFSCYYSGNFVTGFRDGYVQKVYASINRAAAVNGAAAMSVAPVDHSIPRLASTAAATAAAPNPGALRPMVVYGSDSAQYRVALRSIAIDTAAGAVMPLVVSAAGHVTRADVSTTLLPAARQAPRGAASQAMANRDGQPLPPPNVPSSASTAANMPHAADNRVFQPQVRGPDDPLPGSVAAARSATQPSPDGADLRQEQRDAAFVF